MGVGNFIPRIFGNFKPILTPSQQRLATERYTIDALNRLTAVSYPNADTASYSYDAGGNLLTVTATGLGTTTYSPVGHDVLVPSISSPVGLPVRQRASTAARRSWLKAYC